MSFMTAKEYYNYLSQIQSLNPPTQALLAAAGTPYQINPNTRKIEAPEFLSVQRDHKSETVYFIIDRFVDYMDLAETSCVVQYTNETTGKSFLYAVPFYDIVSYNTDTEKKLVFPWCIDGGATEESGVVKYAISFFKIDHEGKKFLYNLNTLPAESKVLYGMNVQRDENEPDYTPFVGLSADNYSQLLHLINQINREHLLYWEEN